jgi:hypothetical protein
MEGNYEKYLAIILAAGVTATTIGIDPKHELQEKEPHFEELFQSDRLNISGTSYAATGIGVVHLFTDNEPHY